MRALKPCRSELEEEPEATPPVPGHFDGSGQAHHVARAQ
jgi:hypothetical protein